MGSHPINLAVRFILEVAALFALGAWAWRQGESLWLRVLLTVVVVVVAAGLWDGAFDGERRRWLLELLELLKPRCRKLTDFVEQGRPYLEPGDAVEYEAKARKKHVKEGTRDLLKELRGRLAALEEWEADPLERTLRELADSRQVSAGKLIHPTRLAVTGRGASPGLFEVLVLLGRDRTLGRMDRLIAQR